ncbi:MAG: hypothetical protein HY756_06115 [Nitrospirae bacterium]|nr:hypothetical protein [Nitrospirota bacterium]
MMRNKELDASFLVMPGWEKCQKRWQKITTGGELWNHLIQGHGANNYTFDELHSYLHEWYDFVSNQEKTGRLPSGEYQWKIAKRLLELAQLAASLPLNACLERKEFPKLSAWDWDVFCALRSNSRQPLRNTRRSLSVLFEQLGYEGCLARLEVEIINNGRAEIYADPQKNAFIAFGKRFLESFKQAWQWVQENTANDERERLSKVDVRFRLERVQIPRCFNPELYSVDGKSAQAAFYLCLQQCVNSYLGHVDKVLVEPSVAVTATLERVNGELHLGAVDGLDAKMTAAYMEGLRTVIVAQEIEEEAKAALERARLRVSPYYSPPTSVVGCKEVMNVLKEALATVTFITETDGEEGILLNASFRCYESLFPPDERDDPADIVIWIDECRRQRNPTFQEVYAVVHEKENVIGMAYLTAYLDCHWCFGNYLGVLPDYRQNRRAEMLLSNLERQLQILDPDAKGIVFEVEPINLELLSEVTRRETIGGHPDEGEVLTHLRRLRRLNLYQSYGALVVLGANGLPLPYWQPSMKDDLNPADELELALMVVLLEGTRQDNVQLNELLDFVYDRLYGDGYGGAGNIEINGFRPYVAGIKRRVKNAAKSGWQLGKWRVNMEIQRLFSRAQKEGLSDKLCL